MQELTKTFLRFVPEDATSPDELVEEVGTCLRLIECEETTARSLPDVMVQRAYTAWELAQESIWGKWEYFTDQNRIFSKQMMARSKKRIPYPLAWTIRAWDRSTPF